MNMSSTLDKILDALAKTIERLINEYRLSMGLEGKRDEIHYIDTLGYGRIDIHTLCVELQNASFSL